jgi:hypothetical protein
MDLVEQAGIDVAPWAVTSEGTPVAVPAANPAYCYEWCFGNNELVVLNLWFDHMLLEDGRVLQRRNMRDLRRRIEQATHLEAGTRTANVRRAVAVDSAVQRAFRDKLVVRVIICDGERRDLDDVESRDPSKVERRLLDPSPWRVTSYDYLGIATGGNATILRDQRLD